ncbi:uncharacterized protein LOC120077268 [Benincasa hispida]|uniref:uncharacterized protein LOC120077268 n=1 Tax=Benincasa hispida TaxID=102211 RepID=UPI0019028626|nr:uncharacterized protein LOC120077268 [Benincasa hispida]
MTSEGESNTPQARADSQLKDIVLDKIAQRLATSVGSVRADIEKKYGIERFKALGAVTFEGTANPAEAELWLDVVEKCFNIMNCPEERKVGLATFLLQKGAEKWWKVIFARRASLNAMLWPEFRRPLKTSITLARSEMRKRMKFLQTDVGTMSMAGYEQKFTELFTVCSTDYC